MVYRYSKANSTWLTAAILEIAITSYLCGRLFDSDEIWCDVVKVKIEVELQYGGSLFSETGNSNTSVMDWDILAKFGTHILKCGMWLNLKIIYYWNFVCKQISSFLNVSRHQIRNRK